jgi:hypothetical protein
MHKELSSLCIRHLQFRFWPSLGATIGTKPWHEGIAAIMKMAVCEFLEKVCETGQQQMADRPLYYLAISSPPRAGPRLYIVEMSLLST